MGRRKDDALSGFAPASLASLAVHAVALLALAAGVRGRVGRDPLATAPLVTSAGAAGVQSEEGDPPTFVDLVPALPESLPPQAPPPPMEGATKAASAGPSLPAPDSGHGSGRPVPNAFRRDRSTLRARLDDGADAYRIARDRTAAHAASPQAERREPVVGLGDSAHARRRAPVAIESPQPISPARLENPDDDSTALLEQASPFSPAGAGSDHSRGLGPLAAEEGERRFDVEAKSEAADVARSRAASNEPHPGRLDLSAPSAAGPADGQAGRGFAPLLPGVSARAPRDGEAPSNGGTAAVSDGAGDPAAIAAERQYERFRFEIRMKVKETLRFPRRLALLLEQGETVVQFVVRPDGRLGSAVKVTKSAGFDEFDAEAVSAVTRAAPFPRMVRALSVSMPIAFDNPLVRTD